MTVYSFLIDFAIAGFLILIGQFVRSKVKFAQSFFVPASLIAGFIGLILGPNGLHTIVAAIPALPFSEGISSYASALIIIVFAAVGINGFSLSTKGMKGEIQRLGGYLCYKTLALSAQMSLPIIFSIVVISNAFPKINNGFGMVLAAGFFGGHGTAAAVGSTFEKQGWADGMDLAMTAATVGILTGIFGGLIFIKWATKKGYTNYIKDFSVISPELKTGLIEKENRTSMGYETISSISLDPLAFHLALLLVPSGIGYVVNSWILKTFELDFPTFTMSFLAALVIFLIFGNGKKGIYKYVDENVVNKLSGTATDFLVFFGVASIKVPVIVEYAVPFAMLMIFGIALVCCMLRVMGPRMCNENWFERSVFIFGYSTGVYAIGMILLRIVDPEYKSGTISDTAITGPFTTPPEMLAWAIGPTLLLSGGHWTFVGIYLAITIAAILIPFCLKWWYAKLPLRR